VHRPECRFFFNSRATGLVATLALACFRCGSLNDEHAFDASLQFEVLDVGQGLAQMVVRNDTAIFIDCGPSEASSVVKDVYRDLGSPYVAAIIISHGHADHYGGLQAIDNEFSWSGRLMAGPYTDSTILAGSLTSWRGPLEFKRVAANDSITLAANTSLLCLWPPDGLGDSIRTSDDLKNRYSLVFRIGYGRTSVMITSDIDSVAESALSGGKYGICDGALFVVPHHGSSTALSPVFYGYLRPEKAIISCARENDYGHPSPDVLLWFAQMGTSLFLTYMAGNVAFVSNGYYWQQDVSVFNGLEKDRNIFFCGIVREKAQRL
jgi:competence protein ComEC